MENDFDYCDEYLNGDKDCDSGCPLYEECCAIASIETNKNLEDLTDDTDYSDLEF